MWPFNNLSTESARKRLERFEEELQGLERRVKGVELEWDACYDKLHSMLGRISKRAEKLHKEAEDHGQLAPLGEEETSVPPVQGLFTTLSPRQRQIQSMIMRRRANGGPQ